MAAPLAAAAQSTPPPQSGIGDIYSTDVQIKGSVKQVEGALRVDNGSVISAGDHTTNLRLMRGGEVRICKGTDLTINSSPKGQALMFAMSSGAIEGDYSLPATADSILTPDFRILISGPAKVNIAVSAKPNGDTCVRSGGEQSYVVVSELMGDSFYRLRPDEQVVFHGGKARDPEANTSVGCGCPVPPRPAPTETAGVPQPTPQQRAAAAESLQHEPAVAAAANAAATLPPPPNSGQVQVQVDAPMVYSGTGAAPDVTQTLARVHVEHLPWPNTPTVSPRPPARRGKSLPTTSGVVTTTSAQPKPKPAQAQPKKGFFHRLMRALFGS